MLETPTILTGIIYILCFVYGIVIGSFVNVLTLRIPRGENFVRTRSHCDSCGHELKWFELIPLASYICLGGKCRKCKARISIQHPLMEVLNGLLYILIFSRFGVGFDTVIYCLLASALLGLSVIDWKIFEIPVGFNYFILCLGVLHLILHLQNWSQYIIGFFVISVFLYILFVVSNGTAIGGGDVKLMAVCGLLLGWKLIIFAFIVGCILGSIIHMIRIKVSGEGRMLAMGPYLSAGVMVALFAGNSFLNWYSSMFSI